MKSWSKLRALFCKGKLDTEMSDEMHAHLELQAERNRAAGMSADDARYAAERQFGGMEQLKEIARDQRGWRWLDELRQDVRYALRALRKNPSFTITAVLTLAFGIGVNAALFTLYNAIALRPLPVREPTELVLVRASGSTGGPRFSYPEYRDYREGNQTFSGLAAWMEGSASLNDAARPRRGDSSFEVEGPGRVAVQFVSDNYFAVIGAEIPLGRDFLVEESRVPGSPPVIVLSHLFWATHLHRDPNVLGQTVSLNGKPHTIVGVTAPEFVGHQPAPPAGWIPLTGAFTPDALASREREIVRLLGRLKPGVNQQQAGADLKRISDIVKRHHPGDHWQDVSKLDRGMKFMNIPVNEKFVLAVAPLLLGFGMVLVIACTNVANLLLARGVTRQQEIGVRLTLGASRGRMFRQLLTENFLLCAISAVAGVLLAQWTLSVALARLPLEWGEHGDEIRHWQFLQVGLDWRIAGYAALVALVAAIAAGLMPALHAARADLISALKDDGTAFGRRLSQSRLRNILVVVQVAVCMMLLSCAGLLARNLIALRHLDLGYDANAIFRVFAWPKAMMTSSRDPTPAEERHGFETLQSLPGIASACQAIWNEWNKGWARTMSVKLPVSGGADRAESLRCSLISAGFFETLGITLQRGRAFTQQEVDAAAPLVVVSEAAALRLWPGENPLGKIIAVGDSAFTGSKRPSQIYREFVVIGLVRNVRSGITDRTDACVYLPLPVGLRAEARTFVRPRSDSASALAELRQTADQAGIALGINQPLSAKLEKDVLPFRLLAWLSGALGGLALLMAAVGLYGVMAFSINQRVREIGIRVALGATTEKVIGLFLRQGMRLVAIGIALGLGGGALFALLLAKIMFGLGGVFDPVAFAGVALLLAVIAMMACYLPARRATKIDPMAALRCE